MLRKILNLFSKKETPVAIEPVVVSMPEPAPEPAPEPVPVVTEIKIADTVTTAVKKTTNRSGRPKK